MIDHPRLRRFVAAALAPAFEVVSADGAARALVLLSDPRAPFDAVVVVCVAAGPRRPLASVSLLRMMFQRWPWIPLVVIADSHEKARIVAETLLTGARDVLGWPFSTAKVRRSVQRAVRRHGPPLRSARALARMKRMLAAVGNDPGAVPTLAQMAAAAGISRSYFSRTFHSSTGMSLRAYVRDLRLKGAYDLLATPGLSLTAIAVAVGFYDLPHFDKAFRKRLGMSPDQFRRRHLTAPARRGEAGPP